jgi:hypothetical protein
VRDAGRHVAGGSERASGRIIEFGGSNCLSEKPEATGNQDLAVGKKGGGMANAVGRRHVTGCGKCLRRLRQRYFVAGGTQQEKRNYKTGLHLWSPKDH